MSTPQGIPSCLPWDILQLLCIGYHCIARIRLLNKHYYGATKQLFEKYRLTQPIAYSEVHKLATTIDTILGIRNNYGIQACDNNWRHELDDNRRIAHKLRRLDLEPSTDGCHSRCRWSCDESEGVSGNFDTYSLENALHYRYSYCQHQFWTVYMWTSAYCDIARLDIGTISKYNKATTGYLSVDPVTFHAIMRMRGVTRTPKKIARKNKALYLNLRRTFRST